MTEATDSAGLETGRSPGRSDDDVVADDGSIEDEERRAYLEQHMSMCREAVRRGLPLKGYFIWTLLDNFEWAWGYSRRFGVVHVDYETQRRTPKASAYWLAGVLGGRLAPKGR
jgi:beta-glucosidase